MSRISKQQLAVRQAKQQQAQALHAVAERASSSSSSSAAVPAGAAATTTRTTTSSSRRSSRGLRSTSRALAPTSRNAAAAAAAASVAANATPPAPADAATTYLGASPALLHAAHTAAAGTASASTIAGAAGGGASANKLPSSAQPFAFSLAEQQNPSSSRHVAPSDVSTSDSEAIAAADRDGDDDEDDESAAAADEAEEEDQMAERDEAGAGTDEAGGASDESDEEPLASTSAGLGTTCLWEGCGEKFSSLEPFVNHLNHDHVQTQKVNYKCMWSTCPRRGKTQTSRFALLSHLRSHTGEKPFTCPKPDCDKSFTRSDALAKHMRIQHALVLHSSRRGGRRAANTSGLTVMTLDGQITNPGLADGGAGVDGVGGGVGVVGVGGGAGTPVQAGGVGVGVRVKDEGGSDDDAAGVGNGYADDSTAWTIAHHAELGGEHPGAGSVPWGAGAAAAAAAAAAGGNGTAHGEANDALYELWGEKGHEEAVLSYARWFAPYVANRRRFGVRLRGASEVANGGGGSGNQKVAAAVAAAATTTTAPLVDEEALGIEAAREEEAEEELFKHLVATRRSVAGGVLDFEEDDLDEALRRGRVTWLRRELQRAKGGQRSVSVLAAGEVERDAPDSPSTRATALGEAADATKAAAARRAGATPDATAAVAGEKPSVAPAATKADEEAREHDGDDDDDDDDDDEDMPLAAAAASAAQTNHPAAPHAAAAARPHRTGAEAPTIPLARLRTAYVVEKAKLAWVRNENARLARELREARFEQRVAAEEKRRVVEKVVVRELGNEVRAILSPRASPEPEPATDAAAAAEGGEEDRQDDDEDHGAAVALHASGDGSARGQARGEVGHPHGAGGGGGGVAGAGEAGGHGDGDVVMTDATSSASRSTALAIPRPPPPPPPPSTRSPKMRGAAGSGEAYDHDDGDLGATTTTGRMATEQAAPTTARPIRRSMIA